MEPILDLMVMDKISQLRTPKYVRIDSYFGLTNTTTLEDYVIKSVKLIEALIHEMIHPERNK